MVVVSHLIEDRIRRAAELVSRHAMVEAVYIFGSHVNETADKYSDIDVAAFVRKTEKWNLIKRSRISAEIQKAVGDDLELHLFSADALEHPEPASFASHVVKTGIRINLHAKH